MATIKTFNDLAAYAAAGTPNQESRVALVKNINAVKVDGVNVITDTPQWGDPVFLDTDGNKIAIKADTFNMSLINSGWTYKGPYLYTYKDGRWACFDGNYTSLPTKKFADVVQFSITNITATTIKFYLHMAGDYAAWVPIEVTLTSAEINATSAAEINSALNAAGNTDNVGYDKHKYWAYLADDNDNKVDSDGTKIIVQCDNWFDYRQYQCSSGSSYPLVGCTMALTVWGDMPATNTYFKRNGQTTNTKGLMNITGASAYWATNSTRVLSAPVAVGSEAGQIDPMTKSDFLTSQYAAALRAAYPTYEDYLRGEFGIRWPQNNYGAFGLPNCFVLTNKYGPKMATTKDGTMKAKFPALNWAYLANNALWGINEGLMIFEDTHLAILNATQRRAGKVQLSNASTRWFAQRYNIANAWYFGGSYRTLTTTNVNSTLQVGAVTLL